MIWVPQYWLNRRLGQSGHGETKLISSTLENRAQIPNSHQRFSYLGLCVPACARMCVCARFPHVNIYERMKWNLKKSDSYKWSSYVMSVLRAHVKWRIKCRELAELSSKSAVIAGSRTFWTSWKAQTSWLQSSWFDSRIAVKKKWQRRRVGGGKSYIETVLGVVERKRE